MKRYLLLVAVLFIAAVGQSGYTELWSTYQQPVLYAGDTLMHGSVWIREGTVPVTSTSTQILVRETIPLATGTYLYSIRAQNTWLRQGYAQEPLFITGPLAIVSPSEQGMATQKDYNLTIETTLSAQCRYTFLIPGSTADFRSFPQTGSLLHTIPSFGEAYNLNANEQVPLLVACRINNVDHTTVLTTGWVNLPQQYTSTLYPNPAGDATLQRELAIVSNRPSSCTLTLDPLGFSYASNNSRRHLFKNIPLGIDGERHIIDCLGADGERYQDEIGGQQDFLVIQPTVTLVHPTQPIQNRNTTVTVNTNVQATCNAQGTGMTSPDGFTHFLYTDVTAINQITCTNTGLSTTITPTFQIDASAPTVNFQVTPQACDGRLIAQLAGGDAGVQYVGFRTSDDLVVRGWPGGTTANYNVEGLNVVAGEVAWIIAMDAAGNTASTTPITVAQAGAGTPCDVIFTQQSITIVNPVNGAGPAGGFDLVIETEFPSDCEWDGTNFTFANGSRQLHSATNFHVASGLTRGEERDFDISCTDDASQTLTETFAISWDLVAPTLNLTANPEVLNDFTSMESNVTLISDHEVICGWNDGALNQNYRRVYSQLFSIIPGEVSRDINITCRNRAGRESFAQVTLVDDFPTDMTMTITSPQITNDDTPPLEVTTTLPANCNYVYGQAQQDLTTTTYQTHATTLPRLTEGTNSILVRCVERFRANKATLRNISIILDNTKPSLDVEDMTITCNLDRIVVNGNASDANGIDYINITIGAGPNMIEEIEDGLPATLNNLDLTENTTYGMTVTAWDNAGNWERYTNTRLLATTRDAQQCDKGTPLVSVQQNNTVSGAIVSLLCFDGETACTDAYKAGTSDPNGACSASTNYQFSRNQTWTFTETTKLCYEVTDLNGNVLRGSKTIFVQQFPSHCSNNVKDDDETGVDCGGSCPVCETGDLCLVDEDCDSGLCGDDFTCQINSCSNGIHDGDETDLDCGFLACMVSVCATGDTCENDLDCASGVCVGTTTKTCAAPSCTDRTQNGDELGVDCGGSCSNACEAGATCQGHSDCAPGNICLDGLCRPEVEGQVPLPPPECEGDDCQLPEGARENKTIPFILIILGLVLAGGGAGYIYYEQGHQKPPQNIPARSNPPMMRTDPLTGVKTKISAQPVITEDFASSELREEARKKRRVEKKQKRDELLGAFEAVEKDEPVLKRATKRTAGGKMDAEKPAEKPTPAKKAPIHPSGSATDPLAKTIGDSEEHAKLRRTRTAKTFGKLAEQYLEDDTLKKHHVASVLSDKQAQGHITDEEAEEISKQLKL